MENEWKVIWNNRNSNSVNLSDRIIDSGFDSKYGGISPTIWQDYVDGVAKKLAVNKNDSIFEIGCGCGAFLMALKKHTARVNGIDYSESLLKHCFELNPSGFFSVMEANEIGKNNQERKYDVIISNSVFQYFPNLEYTNSVLSGIDKILNTNGRFALLDINDEEKKASYHLTRAKEFGSIKKYNEMYKSTPHLFYSKSYFINWAKRKNYKIEISDQTIKEYINAKFRYNVFLWKE